MSACAATRFAGLASALFFASTVFACERNPPQLVCRVIVDAAAAVATFPLVESPFVWRWLRATTANDAMEYRWLAEFGQCSDRGIFETGEYSFGISIFKFPGETERNGMLTDLLRFTQKDFMRRTRVGDQVHYTRIDGANVDARYDAGSIVIRARGKSALTQLVATHPPYALLTVNIPDQGQSYTCIAKAEYK
jgi:hypothetical protein